MKDKLFNKKNILILIVMVLIMALGLFLYLSTFTKEQETNELLEKFLPLPPRIVTIEPFTVTLMEQSPFGEVYPEALVKMAITLEVKTKKERRLLTKYLPEIKNIVSETVAEKKLIEIDDINADRMRKKKRRLRRELYKKIKEMTGLANLNNLFFYEWFIQTCPSPPPPEIKT